MKRFSDLWHQIISFENVYTAAMNAAKGKGLKPCVLIFFQNFEKNILAIQSELKSKTYRPESYTTFYVFEPKKRMISASPFRDRVVHHCLMNVIGPIFERTFIKESFANQVDKGTHRAIKHVQKGMHFSRFALHCDIKKYFATIDHDILKSIVARKIKDHDVLWLVDLIIDYSNEQEPVFDYFAGDTLFTPCEKRKGLPIGNLTSQYFANIYLWRLSKNCFYFLAVSRGLIFFDFEKL